MMTLAVADAENSQKPNKFGRAYSHPVKSTVELTTLLMGGGTSP